MSTAIASAGVNNLGSNVSPRLPTTPRASPRVPQTSSPVSAPSQPILTTGSVPSEVTHLFRTKRVSEIRAFESRIRVEADDKSESLRHLLGTRYRDLLSAADRISEMCDGANKSVRDALQTVYKTSGQLRDDLRARVTTASNSAAAVDGDREVNLNSKAAILESSPMSPSSASDADLAQRRAVHAVGSRLKHIVDSPEVLYACLEAGELYEAAARYITAQRNFNAIVDNPTRESAVASRFAQARWKLVSAFKAQIISAAERRLVTSGLDSRAYARVFAAIVLLQADQCDVVSIAEKLLSARTTWLLEVRHRYKQGDASAAMRDIAVVVRDTITCMSELFWKGVSDKHESTTTSNSHQGVEALLRQVDDSCCQLVVSARERGGLNGAVIAWTSNVRSWLQDNGDALLASAATSRQVALALKAVDDILSEPHWAEHCQASLQRSPDFVFDIFKPFISARAGVVAEECVHVAVKRVLADIAVAWDDISGLCDVGKGMWMAMSGQAINLGHHNKSSLGNNDSAAASYDRLRSSNARHLDEERDVARMLVYNGAVAYVVDTFESCLKEALTDVKTLAQRVSSVVVAFDSAMGSNVPQVFDALQKLVTGLMKKAAEMDVDQRDIAMEQCLFAARAATALAHTDCIADALKFIAISSASDHSNNATSSHASRNRTAGLVELQVRAAAVSGMAYSMWAKLLCDGLAPTVEQDLTWERRLVIEMGWVGATNDLDGKANTLIQDNEPSTPASSTNTDVDAAVRHPTTASTAVVNMLLKACKAASQAGGFALPVEAVEFVRDAMTKVIVRVYSDVLKTYTDSSSVAEMNANGGSAKKTDNDDKAVMQMLFDVQCLQILLGDMSNDERLQLSMSLSTTNQINGVSSGSNSGSTTSLKQLESEIQARIDPIDLASCRKALRESVANYVARTSILFGPVVRRRDGRTPWAGVVRGSTYTSTAVANLVSLAPPVQRFTYLPAPMPSTYNSAGAVGINAKAVVGALRNEAAAASAAAVSGTAANRKRESVDTSVAGYASKVSESVGRFGRGFFESLTRKVA